MKKTIIPFNVINYEFNSKKFEPYDVMPYLIDCYKKVKRRKCCPKTFDEFKAFVKSESQYQFWSRCEYEIILSDWPSGNEQKKIDVYEQIMMNLDLVTDLLMKNVL